LDVMTNFIGLSAVLTGFNQTVIAPELDPVDIKSAYLKEWQSQVASESGKTELTETILTQFAALQAKKLTDQQIGERMLADSNDAEFILACRKLIFLWYMGAWPNIMESSDPETGSSTSFTTLSAASYTSGLVWKVMQSHPMGDSNYRYGYWTEPPAALSDYTGNQDEG